MGILYFAAGMFLFAAVDTMAKVLTESFHPLQVAWSRQLGLFMGIVVLLVIKGTVILQDRSLLSTGFARLFSSSFSPNVYICNISSAYC